MAPSMQIDRESLVVFNDEALTDKRMAVQFTSADSVSFGAGTDATAVRLGNIATPQIPSDVANKAYVDASIQGLTVKRPCRVLADVDAPFATGYAAGSVVDGETLAEGDRILLIAQSDSRENGIWVVAASGAPSRPDDFAVGSSGSGAYIFIDQGATMVDRSFVCVTNLGSDVVGTNTLEFAQFGARPSALAGFGLQVGTGNALDVNTSQIATLGIANTFTGPTNTFTGDIDCNGSATITTSVTTAAVAGLDRSQMTSDNSAVSVKYVADQFNGFSYKYPVHATSTESLSSPAEAALTVGAVVDGVTLAEGHRVLLKNQTNAHENGIYVVKAAGSVRSDDLPAASHADGAFLFTIQGTVNGDQVFVCTNDKGTAVVGTDNLVFSGLVAQSGTLAGAGLVSDENRSLHVNPDDVTIEVVGDQVRMKDGGITSDKIAAASIANDRLVNDDVSVLTARGLAGGATLNLGDSTTITVDHSVIPDLQATNVFSAANSISDATESTSQTTGALVITGGLGVGGNIFTTSTFNMSDQTLKSDVAPIPVEEAQRVIDKVQGYTFKWNDHEVNQKCQRAGGAAVGIIAQEAEANCPLAVTKTDAGAGSMLAVDYTRLVPYLLVAVRDLQGKLARGQAPLRAGRVGTSLKRKRAMGASLGSPSKAARTVSSI